MNMVYMYDCLQIHPKVLGIQHLSVNCANVACNLFICLLFVCFCPEWRMLKEQLGHWSKSSCMRELVLCQSDALLHVCIPFVNFFNVCNEALQAIFLLPCLSQSEWVWLWVSFS